MKMSFNKNTYLPMKICTVWEQCNQIIQPHSQTKLALSIQKFVSIWHFAVKASFRKRLTDIIKSDFSNVEGVAWLKLLFLPLADIFLRILSEFWNNFLKRHLRKTASAKFHEMKTNFIWKIITETLFLLILIAVFTIRFWLFLVICLTVSYEKTSFNNCRKKQVWSLETWRNYGHVFNMFSKLLNTLEFWW